MYSLVFSLSSNILSLNLWVTILFSSEFLAWLIFSFSVARMSGPCFVISSEKSLLSWIQSFLYIWKLHILHTFYISQVEFDYLTYASSSMLCNFERGFYPRPLLSQVHPESNTGPCSYCAAPVVPLNSVWLL